MKNRQSGHAITILLAIIIILALGLAFWWVWYQNKGKDKNDEAASITIGVFAPSLTTMVADSQRFLEEEDVNVEYAQVTGSEQQFQALLDGEYDLILTSPDNVAHYRLNESNALGGAFDVQAVAGTNKGQGLSLVVQPDIENFEDLMGKTLAVDSPFSGFAYVMYQMLRNHGLEKDEDYQLTEAGGASDRYEALLNNEFAGTLLLSGSELRAEAAGKVILESAAETIPDYLGGVVAGRQSWMGENRDAVERLLSAYQKANDWIFDNANRDAAIALIVQESEVSEELAAQMYEVQTSAESGLIRDQQIGQDEFHTILKLRQDWGGFDDEQDIDTLAKPEGGLYDTTYLPD